MTIPIKPAVKNSILALSLLAGLSACGGGGGGGGGSALTSAKATNSVPASAAASTSSFVAYLKTLPTNETEEPLNASSVTPPTTDSDEPTNV